MAIPILGNEFWMSPTMGGVNSSTAVGLMAQQGAELSKKIEIDSQKNEAKAKAPAIGQIYQQAYERIASGDTGGFADLSLAGAMTTGNPFLMAMHKDVTDVAGHLSQQFLQRSMQEERLKMEETLQQNRLETELNIRGTENDRQDRDYDKAALAIEEDDTEKWQTEENARIKANAEAIGYYNAQKSMGIAVGPAPKGIPQKPKPNTPNRDILRQRRLGAGGNVNPVGPMMPTAEDNKLTAGITSSVEPQLPEEDVIEDTAAGAQDVAVPVQKEQPSPFDAITLVNKSGGAFDSALNVYIPKPGKTLNVSAKIGVGITAKTKVGGGPITEEEHKAFTNAANGVKTNSDALGWFLNRKLSGKKGELEFTEIPGSDDPKKATYVMKFGGEEYSEKIYKNEEGKEVPASDKNKPGNKVIKSEERTKPVSKVFADSAAVLQTAASAKKIAIIPERGNVKNFSAEEKDKLRGAAIDKIDKVIKSNGDWKKGLAELNEELEILGIKPLTLDEVGVDLNERKKSSSPGYMDSEMLLRGSMQF